MQYCYHPQIHRAARAIAAGQVVAYPTEAVWGLGCHPHNLHAVQHILALKRRDPAKGLILVGAEPEHFAPLLDTLTQSQREQMLASWPGPNTWLVPHNNHYSPWVTGVHSTVAIRVSAHPVVQALCRWLGGAIVSTSANPQGMPPARFGYKARRYFSDAVVYAPGQVNLSARPSQIRDLITGKILRPS